jgi:hypothetical protein
MPMTNVADVAKCRRVLVTLVEVHEALHAMGLSIDELHQSIDAGEVDRDQCNELNPPTDGGIRAHGTTVRALREIYLPKGWSRADEKNFSTIASSDGAIEIAVASGDDATGNPGRIPLTKYTKGEAVVDGIERNKQMVLFEGPAPRTEGKITWFLLRHRSGNIVHCELSMPTSLASDRRVIFGGTRIILPDFELDSRGGISGRDDEPSQIDVTVTRRRA